jgi:hypothetical protein
MRDWAIVLTANLANIVVLGAFIYLVDQRGWNPWWMVFPLLYVTHYSFKNGKEETKED